MDPAPSPPSSPSSSSSPRFNNLHPSTSGSDRDPLAIPPPDGHHHELPRGGGASSLQPPSSPPSISQSNDLPDIPLSDLAGPSLPEVNLDEILETLSGKRKRKPYAPDRRAEVAALRRMGACAKCRRRRVQCHPSHERAELQDPRLSVESDDRTLNLSLLDFPPNFEQFAKHSDLLEAPANMATGMSISPDHLEDKMMEDLVSISPQIPAPLSYFDEHRNRALERNTMDGLSARFVLPPINLSVGGSSSSSWEFLPLDDPDGQAITEDEFTTSPDLAVGSSIDRYERDWVSPVPWYPRTYEGINKSRQSNSKTHEAFAPSAGASDLEVFLARRRLPGEQPPFRQSTGEVHNLPGPVNDRFRRIGNQDNETTMLQVPIPRRRSRPPHPQAAWSVQGSRIRHRSPHQGLPMPQPTSQPRSRAVSGSSSQSQSSPATSSSTSANMRPMLPVFAPRSPSATAEAQVDVPQVAEQSIPASTPIPSFGFSDIRGHGATAAEVLWLPGQWTPPAEPMNNAIMPYDRTGQLSSNSVPPGAVPNRFFNIMPPAAEQQPFHGRSFQRPSYGTNFGQTLPYEPIFDGNRLPIEGPGRPQREQHQPMFNLNSFSATAPMPDGGVRIGQATNTVDQPFSFLGNPQASHQPYAVSHSLASSSSEATPSTSGMVSDSEHQQTVPMLEAVHPPNISSDSGSMLSGTPISDASGSWNASLDVPFFSPPRDDAEGLYINDLMPLDQLPLRAMDILLELLEVIEAQDDID